MTNSVQRAQQIGQAIWYDNISRDLISSGELRKLIDMGVTGLTSNPTIFEKAISTGSEYDDALSDLARRDVPAMEAYEKLVTEDIRAAADLLRPIYDRTDGADGYASLEVNPALAHDTDATIAEARRLFADLDRPNVMVKVPATPEGIPAVRRLIGDGININITLIFSLTAYRQVIEAYLAGLEDLASVGGDVGRIASVASFFVSRVDTAVDSLIQERVSRGNEELESLMGQAAVANAKLAYQDFSDNFGGERFVSLQVQGAHVQRPLWASTSTKNPAYSDLLYVEPLIGSNTVNTMPPATLSAFLDHGKVIESIGEGVIECETALSSLASAGIEMEQVTAGLLDDGVKAFADSFNQLLDNIALKNSELVGRGAGGT